MAAPLGGRAEALGLKNFKLTPSLCPGFPELRRTGRFRLNGQARSDTGSTAASGLKKRAALLWHGKSLWCRQCFASQIAASERETRFDRP
jgi:hypothetical protein